MGGRVDVLVSGANDAKVNRHPSTQRWQALAVPYSTEAYPPDVLISMEQATQLVSDEMLKRHRILNGELATLKDDCYRHREF